MAKKSYIAAVSIAGMLLTGLFSIATAEYSVPVNHSHNGRDHNHQLPKEGVAHRHGIGQLGQAARQQNRVIYSSTTSIPNKPAPTTQNNNVSSNSTHSHSGRSHDHPLPSAGVSHRHGNGDLGQSVNSTQGTVVYRNQNNTPTSNSNVNRYRSSTTRDPWRHGSKRRISKYTKGVTTCRRGDADCNVCAANVQQQFQKAAAKQINWSRKRWDFRWPQAYPPKNLRPLDIFDGDAKYALGIPNKHIQGFVRTNSRRFPYVGTHSHKRKGGFFVVQRNKNGEQFLSSLHRSTGKHPSGVQIIGKYAVYGEGTRLFFRDINSSSHSSQFSMTAEGANFGGGLGIIKLADNNHLLITTGPGGQRPQPRFNRFYHLKSGNGRPTALRLINQSGTNKLSQWPTILNYSENMSLITECGTGDVYSVHTTGDQQGFGAVAGRGYWRLSKLVDNGTDLGLKAVNAFTTAQDLKRCNVRAAATVSVNSRNRLEFVCHGYAKDPDGSGFNILGSSSRDRDKFYFNVGEVR